MDLKTFIEQTDPEVLQKLASEAQDELVEKVANRVIEVMFPLFEKTAGYTVQLMLEKLAEEAQAQESSEGEQPSEKATPAEAAKEVVLDSTPVTGNPTNESVDPSVTPGGMKAQQVKDALIEAIQVGQSEKIVPFVKALAGQYPESVNEVIKMVKVQLHDGIMKKLLDEEQALSISDQLNAMVGESK